MITPELQRQIEELPHGELARLWLVIGQLMLIREQRTQGQDRPIVAAKLGEGMCYYIHGPVSQSFEKLAKQLMSHYGGAERKL